MAIEFVGGTSASYTNINGWSVSLTALEGGIDTRPRAGDTVLVLHAATSTSNFNPGVSTSGYSEIADLYHNATRDINLSVSWKRMDSTPDSSVSINPIATLSVAKVVVVLVFRGVDPYNPIDVNEATATSASSAGQTAYPVPGITPMHEGAVIVSALGATYSANSSSTLAPPTGYDGAVSAITTTASSAFAAMGFRPWTGGSVGSETWTRSGTATIATADSYAAVTFVLRPIQPEVYTESFSDNFDGSAQLLWSAIVDGSHTTSYANNMMELTAAPADGFAGMVRRQYTPAATMENSFYSFRYKGHSLGSGATSNIRVYTTTPNGAGDAELGVTLSYGNIAIPYGRVGTTTYAGTSFSIAVNDLIRFRAPLGGMPYIERSSDNGVTWVTVYTFTSIDTSRFKRTKNSGPTFNVYAYSSTDSSSNVYVALDDFNIVALDDTGAFFPFFFT